VEEGLSSFFLKSHGSKSRIVVCEANARATLSEPAFEICLDFVKFLDLRDIPRTSQLDTQFI
jgi:hypothetical protein